MTQTAAGSELAFVSAYLKQLSGRPVRLGKDYTPPATVPAVEPKHRFTPSSAQSIASSVSDTPGTMNVTFTVKPLKGSGGEHTLSLPPSATITQLKYQLEPLTGLACKDQRLVIKGKALQDANTLADYAVANGSIVHVLAKPGAVPTIPVVIRAAVENSPMEKSPTTQVRNLIDEPKFWADLRNFLREQSFAGGQSEADQVLKEFMNVYKQNVRGLKPEDLDKLSSL